MNINATSPGRALLTFSIKAKQTGLHQFPHKFLSHSLKAQHYPAIEVKNFSSVVSHQIHLGQPGLKARGLAKGKDLGYLNQYR